MSTTTTIAATTSTPTPTRLYFQNAHPRDANIRFTESGHKYTVINEPAASYTSATTWVSTKVDKFDADKVIAKMINGENWNSQHKYWGFTPGEIKAQWNQSGAIASAAGTCMHAEIEHFMNPLETVVPGVYTHADLYANYIATKPITPDSDTTPSTVREWQWFLQFVRDTPHFKPYRTEWMVYDSRAAIAGSIDMVYENDDGTLSIYDWKRSGKEISSAIPRWKTYFTDRDLSGVLDTTFWRYAIQLNIYRHILETVYDNQIRDLVLVQLHPDNDTYKLIPVPRMDTEMNAMFARRTRDHPITTQSLAPPPIQSLAPPPIQSLAPPPTQSLAPPPTQSLAPPPTQSLAPPPIQSLAPPTQSLAPPPIQSLAPPTQSLAPPTQSLAPPTQSLAPPPTQSLAPPTQSLAPPTQSLAPPPIQSLAPPTQSLAPPTQSLAPPTQSLAPPTQSLAPPLRPSRLCAILYATAANNTPHAT